MKWSLSAKITFVLSMGLTQLACDSQDSINEKAQLADGVFAVQGQARPNASSEEQELFKLGEAVAKKRFTLNDGLGPHFNVTFCGSCHEKPAFGGAAGHYRDFYLYGESLNGGGFVPSGPRSGVLNTFSKPSGSEEVFDANTESSQLASALSKILPESDANLYTRRNPIPFFGIGLLAEIPEAEILSRADPDDRDGDGISGRPNYDQGYVGRFGLKAQTVSIENFIRGPLFNHLGITTNPLSAELQAALPVPSVADERSEESGDDSSLDVRQQALRTSEKPVIEQRSFHQAAAPSEPLTDSDGIPDPELAEEDLYALVSWAMLLAAPLPDPLGAQEERGQGLFYAMGCDLCHAPALKGPRGLIPAYTDLLLHDMGEELADGIVMALANGSEFRTQPLWGVSSTGPYLYDGRAGSLDEAIVLHAGEAAASSRAYQDASVEDRLDLISFLESLGGRAEKSSGLIPPQAEIGSSNFLGIPSSNLNEDELVLYKRGQQLFDTDFTVSKGLGPIFNGDSCRGCHFEPFVGGAGPTGVSAVRQLNTDFESMDSDGALIRRFNAHGAPPSPLEEESLSTEFEIRQALPSYGLGIIAAIPDEAIVANADPNDLDNDGVSGQVRYLEDGSVGRYGWRAQISNIRDFVGDALALELSMTIPKSLNIPTAIYSDQDSIEDPEFSVEDFEALSFFLSQLAPPVTVISDEAQAQFEQGESLFTTIGCSNCHIPKLSESQSHEAYTDLLLHYVQQASTPNRSFKTPPLWGLAYTGTYWHDGRASTINEAIQLHAGEASSSLNEWSQLSNEAKQALLIFLEHI